MTLSTANAATSDKVNNKPVSIFTVHLTTVNRSITFFNLLGTAAIPTYSSPNHSLGYNCYTDLQFTNYNRHREVLHFSLSWVQLLYRPTVHLITLLGTTAIPTYSSPDHSLGYNCYTDLQFTNYNRHGEVLHFSLSWVQLLYRPTVHLITLLGTTAISTYSSLTITDTKKYYIFHSLGYNCYTDLQFT